MNEYAKKAKDNGPQNLQGLSVQIMFHQAEMIQEWQDKLLATF
jgi:hypothetical protein